MTDLMIFLAVSILIIFVTITILATINNKRDHTPAETQDILKTLNYMHQCGIITSEQYNQMHQKAIPYLKR